MGFFTTDRRIYTTLSRDILSGWIHSNGSICGHQKRDSFEYKFYYLTCFFHHELRPCRAIKMYIKKSEPLFDRFMFNVYLIHANKYTFFVANNGTLCHSSHKCNLEVSIFKDS